MDNTTERIAVLEQIARNTESVLSELRTDYQQFKSQHHTDFLWLLTFQISSTMLLLGVMAHGFKWI